MVATRPEMLEEPVDLLLRDVFSTGVAESRRTTSHIPREVPAPKANRQSHESPALRVVETTTELTTQLTTELTAAIGVATPPAAPALDDREPTDAELAELTAEEEDALYGKGAGHYGGADGAEDAFQSYLHDIRGLSLLSHEEELILAKRAQAGDTRARRRLIEANLRLVISIARRYTNSGVPLIDLIQEGNLGLMRAAEKFDWRRGCHFGTYATWWIRQAISRAAGEQSRLIHLPEHVATRLRKVRRVASQLSQENGGDPLPDQIAGAAGMPIEEVDDLLHITEQPVSLDTPADVDNRLSLADTLEDPGIQAPADIASQHLLGEELHRALSQLTARERSVVILRYGIGDGRSRTLLEVGKELGISRERVRQLEMVALAKLRTASMTQSLRETI